MIKKQKEKNSKKITVSELKESLLKHNKINNSENDDETVITKQSKLYVLEGCKNCERTCKIQAIKGAKLYGCKDYKAKIQ